MKTCLMMAGLLLAIGCGGSSNDLFGSVSEVYSLDFQTVTINQIDQSLVVEYLVGATMTSGIATKLTVDMTGLTVTPNEEIDLTTVVAGNPRGTLEQINTMTVEFPFSIGKLTLTQVPTAHMPLSGHFATTLSTPTGRTLNGDFSGTLIPL